MSDPILSDPILTDADGRPIEKPRRPDFATDRAYLAAFYAYKDRIAAIAREAFTQGFKL